jgi:membrane protein
MTLGPLLLAGSVMLGHSARAALAGMQVVAATAGALLTCVFFSLLYLIVPNTKVKLRNAAAGGLVAGLAWEVAKWAYATFVARSVRYSAIYGSVAAVPIFLLWLYVSWAILLFGARLAFVFQYASSFLNGGHAESRTGKEITAGRALLAIARAFDTGAPPPDAGEVANQLGISADDASDALRALRNAGLVVTLGDGGLVPARPLERISLLDVRRALFGREAPPARAAGPVPAIVRSVEDEAAERLSETTFRILCDRERGAASGARGDAPSEGADAADASLRRG